MTYVRRPLSALLSTMGALSLITLAGCSNNPVDYPDTAPVTGTVTLDGQPVEGATVAFVPSEGGGRPSSGKTDANGKYELYYTGTIRGATLGSHLVGITKMISDPDYAPSANDLRMMKAMAEEMGDSPEDHQPPAPQVNSLPERYSGSASELSADVKSGKNTFDFDLTS